jgi:kynurenine 3-monooxygenase
VLAQLGPWQRCMLLTEAMRSWYTSFGVVGIFFVLLLLESYLMLKRTDLRDSDTTPLNFTKSINLALSERGINALRSSGHPELLEAVLEQTLPMSGRMIHIRNTSGKLVDDSQAYDVHGRFQRSVDRGMLNKTILDMLDDLPNVTLCFQHKLSGADFRRKKAWFEILSTKSASAPGRPREIEISFDLMVGADGAHSATRQNLMKYARMEYTQTYIDCLWCEFTMPKSNSGDFRISPNHLHIWPGGSFMFIALPNVDKSFTCTFFGPVDLFKRLESSSEEDLVAFFDSSLPGVTAHIQAQDLFDQFKRNPHLPLINLKCTPHHFEDSGVILGDAANAMVPFYGQGMNAGLESVRVLFEKLDSSSSVLGALQSYTDFRTQDTYAITDLALANYVEMRASVVSPTYKLRKFIEERLDKYFPKLGWATQYSRVSFSNMRYSEIIERAKYQKRVLTLVLMIVGGLQAAGAVRVVTWALHNRRGRLR